MNHHNSSPIHDAVKRERERVARVQAEPEPYDQDNPPAPRHARAHNAATPNVVLKSPRVRKIANIVLGTAGLLLGATMTADAASPAIDWSAFTLPAFAVYSFMAGAFGLAVTTPNVPGKL